MQLSRLRKSRNSLDSQGSYPQWQLPRTTKVTCKLCAQLSRFGNHLLWVSFAVSDLCILQSLSTVWVAGSLSESVSCSCTFMSFLRLFYVALFLPLSLTIVVSLYIIVYLHTARSPLFSGVLSAPCTFCSSLYCWFLFSVVSPKCPVSLW